MKFHQTGNVAISECGDYEIRMATHPANRKLFYNAYYVPTGASIVAGFDKKAIKAACEGYVAELAARAVRFAECA